MTANVLTRNILAYLNIMGIKAWRNNTGAVSMQGNANQRSRFVRYGVKGSGDILGVMRGGRFISIEIKAGRDKLRESQQEWIDEIEALGGIAFVARSEQDVVDRIEREMQV